MVSVFNFTDYKAYLKAIERERVSVQRGFRSRLAEVLSCQNAYISQVLNTSANFSLEHALQIAIFLELQETESRYFLLLIEEARAGTKALRNFFSRDIEKLREQFLNIKERVPSEVQLTCEQQTLYYSSWLYPAIHILITIPRYRTLAQISEVLGLEDAVVREAILFLISANLVIEVKGSLRPGPAQIHLGKESPHLRRHHTNWRIRAIQSMTSTNKYDIHYTTVSSVSLEDAEHLKSKFVQMIQDYVETIKPSKEETLYNFNLDFYSLLRK